MIGKVLESGMKAIDHLRSSMNGKRNADEADTIVAWHLPKRRVFVFPSSQSSRSLHTWACWGPIAVDSLPSK